MATQSVSRPFLARELLEALSSLATHFPAVFARGSRAGCTPSPLAGLNGHHSLGEHAPCKQSVMQTGGGVTNARSGTKGAPLASVQQRTRRVLANDLRFAPRPSTTRATAAVVLPHFLLRALAFPAMRMGRSIFYSRKETASEQRNWIL